MEENKNYEEMFGQFVDYQKNLHEQNQKKIRVGLKVNILLPLVFLIISFITDGSKLIFLILWIVSLFGIAFYLLYVEYTDFKLQSKMKEFGVVEDEEHQALIGAEVLDVVDRFDELEDFELFADVKELRAGIQGDIKEIRSRIRNNEDKKQENDEDNEENDVEVDVLPVDENLNKEGGEEDE